MNYLTAVRNWCYIHIVMSRAQRVQHNRRRARMERRRPLKFGV